MILQALTRLFDDLVKRGEARPGWIKTGISYALCISEDGDLEQVISLLMDTGGKNPLPRWFDLPAPVLRHGQVVKSNFLWDHSGYLLGVRVDSKRKLKKSVHYFENSKCLHHQLLDGVDSPAARAVLCFFDRWDPECAASHPALDEDRGKIFSGSGSSVNLIFRFNGRFVHEDPLIDRAWQVHYDQTLHEGPSGQCLVTGVHDIIARTHPSIRNIGSKAESALVSFNEPAFCSYGKEQSYNAPVGKSTAFAYTAALNHLLADWKHVKEISDAKVVCWAEGAEPQYQPFSMTALWGDPPPSGLKNDDLWSAVDRLARGWPCDELRLDPNRPFYILGLAPNAARLSARFFYRDTFGHLMRNIKRHYKDMKMFSSAFKKYDVVFPKALLMATVRKPSPDKKDKKPPTPDPVMSGATMRAIFTGQLYPVALLHETVLRIRAEQDVTWEQASIIKAYYTRLQRYYERQNSPQNVIAVKEGAMGERLDKSCTYQPYVLGRLFAVMERIQVVSAGGSDELNRTIKHSYFSTVATTPNMIFKRLFPLNEHHMKKLKRDDPRSAESLEKVKVDLICKITAPIPDKLEEDASNCFYIGYYHQKQELDTKKGDM